MNGVLHPSNQRSGKAAARNDTRKWRRTRRNVVRWLRGLAS